MSSPIAKEFPELKFIVQDLPKMVGEAKTVRVHDTQPTPKSVDARKIWNETLSGAVELFYTVCMSSCHHRVV